MTLPPDYFASLAAVEDSHWWHRGMRSIAACLLRELPASGGPLLDAGCGTGGFLAWAETLGYGPLAGVDPSPEAVAATRRRLPGADVRVAELATLPFPDASFAIVTCNDVLQHVSEEDGPRSLGELRRVVRADGALLVRTNGGRPARRDAADWRLFDAGMLRAELEAAGFRCLRLSYANAVGSLVATARGRVPRAPTSTHHGIPAPAPGRLRAALLRLEGELIRRGVRLPTGHTLVALAVPVAAPDSTTRSPVAADR